MTVSTLILLSASIFFYIKEALETSITFRICGGQSFLNLIFEFFQTFEE